MYMYMYMYMYNNIHVAAELTKTPSCPVRQQITNYTL